MRGLRADGCVVLDAPYYGAATRRVRPDTIVLGNADDDGDRWWEAVWGTLRSVDYQPPPPPAQSRAQQQQPQVRVPQPTAAAPEPTQKARRIDLNAEAAGAIEKDVEARIARTDFSATSKPKQQLSGFLKKPTPMVPATPSPPVVVEGVAAVADERVRAWYDAWHAAAMADPAAPQLPDVYRTLYANGRRGIGYDAFLRGDTGKAVMAFAKFALG